MDDPVSTGKKIVDWTIHKPRNQKLIWQHCQIPSPKWPTQFHGWESLVNQNEMILFFKNLLQILSMVALKLFWLQF